jgi:hypothetical protein
LIKTLSFSFLLFLLFSRVEITPDPNMSYSQIRSWYQKNKAKPITFFPTDQNHSKFNQSIIQIILIRHGNPQISKNGWFSYKAARNYIYRYDTVGVFDFDNPPVEIRPKENVEIYCSTLNRAYDTALKIFGDPESIKTDSIFIEFQREIIPLPLIRLPINGWTTLSRFFWALGLHSIQVPSFRTEKSRAKNDAWILEMAALENKKIILIAHGFLNKYIVKYLKKNGWDHSYNGGNDYLTVQVMTKIIDE